MKNRAFTLAEVLITLVVIGVIAAITIPVLQNNYTDQERISRMKKTYSTLAQAMVYVRMDGGDMIFEIKDGNVDNLKEWFSEYLQPRLVVLKTCYDTTGCWYDKTTKYYNGSTASSSGKGIGGSIITAVLNDGSFINLDAYNQADIASLFGVNIETDAGLVIYFDVNGMRKPNVVGKDIFATVFTEDGLVPAYKDKTVTEIINDCSTGGTGISCLRRYLAK